MSGKTETGNGIVLEGELWPLPAYNPHMAICVGKYRVMYEIADTLFQSALPVKGAISSTHLLISSSVFQSALPVKGAIVGLLRPSTPVG